MTLIEFKDKYSAESSIIQKRFFQIRMKDYFEYLGDMTGDSRFYCELYKKYLNYTDTDQNYVHHFNHNDDTVRRMNPDITIGQMLLIARNMLSTENNYCECLYELASETGEDIVYNIMVKPFVKLVKIIK